jgi:hypothetical protein
MKKTKKNSKLTIPLGFKDTVLAALETKPEPRKKTLKAKRKNDADE